MQLLEMHQCVHFAALISTHTKALLPTCASVQCLLDDGLAEHRICQYHNLVLYHAKFLYMYQGEPSLQDADVCRT
jgi:hypothetical protein